MEINIVTTKKINKLDIDDKEVYIGSDNVFKDLDFVNPEERLAKSELAAKINSILKARNLTQKEAAKILGITQPKVSFLARGIVSGFSLEKLIIMLNLLDQDVDIVIHAKNNRRYHGRRHLNHGHVRVLCV